MILFTRALDGIPIMNSRANARMNNADQTTYEAFFWPIIPADVIADAKSFRDDLADPTKLAAYKAKLPANAQGEGSVVIQHTEMVFTPDATFRAGATWDTVAGSSPMSFDRDGKPTGPW